MLRLSVREIECTSEILAMLRRRYRDAQVQELLIDAPVHARRLPLRVQEYINAFRRQESGYGVISGYPVDDAEIGPTPRHWNHLPPMSPTLDHDLLLVLYAALLGDAFGWATQQDGRIIHDVLPIKEDEGGLLSSTADVPLGWHTEDAFHPCRPDWVLLACIRNPTETATTIAMVDDLELDEHDVTVLFEPRFRIVPDDSHLPQHNSSESTVSAAIERHCRTSSAVPILCGDSTHPYIGADQDFCDVSDPGDADARAALRRLAEEIDRRLHDIVLRPGDFCFLDNFKVVHGRRSFPAIDVLHDGGDARPNVSVRDERGEAIPQVKLGSGSCSQRWGQLGSSGDDHPPEGVASHVRR
ncbi:MAG: guanitoxin biosynthesis L-enduracididine beta-hydroxylase GntD [Pseudonocardiaceae bacterium]